MAETNTEPQVLIKNPTTGYILKNPLTGAFLTMPEIVTSRKLATCDSEYLLEASDFNIITTE